MKFTLKTIAAALALAAAAQAQAADNVSDLYLAVFNSDYTYSYIRDLGVKTTDINTAAQSATYTTTWAADANMPAAPAANPGLSYEIFGFVNSITTSHKVLALSSNVATNLVASSFGAKQTALQTQAGNVSLASGVAGDLLASGAAYSSNPSDAWNISKNVATGVLSMGFNLSAAQGTALSMNYLTVSSSNLVPATYAETFTLANDGTLTYGVAAVPEADTWVLMVGGLLVVGGIARRRLAV